MSEPFPVSGNIEPASFPHLLVDLHRHGATGSLKVTGPGHPKALYFRGGRILFGSSNDPRDQLGAILIESGRITRQQLDEVNGKVGPGNPLAKVLSDGGFVNQRELGDAARVKVERILADVLAWESGSFEFEDGVLPKGAVDLKLSTEKLLLAAVQRVPDRAFALRHVDLDMVLELTPEAESGLSEIRAEVWPLLERLDGRRTLKDAISLTRLDEFEAAKTACALLFLGIIRPRGVEPELDLAQEAQNGFAIEEDSRSYTVPLPSVEPTGFALAETDDRATPEPEPPVFTFEPVPVAVSSEPTLPASFAFEPEPEPAPEPAEPVAEREASPRDAAAETLMFNGYVEAEPAPEAQDDEPMIVADAPHDLAPEEPTFIMPPPQEADPEISIAPAPSASPASGRAAASRPSEQDLAALDALLNPSASVRSERPAERPAQEKWEPQFRPAATPPPRRPPARVAPRGLSSASRLPILGAALAGVLLATVAAWYFFLRAPVAPRTVAAAPRPVPTAPITTMPAVQATPTPPGALATPPAPVTSQSPAPALAATPAVSTPAVSTPVRVPPPTPAATAPRREAAPRATTAPAIPQGRAASTADAHALLARGALPEAARAFATSVAAGPRTRLSLQLLTACSPETVQKAVGAVGSPDLFILPVSLQGRSCYRVCWGLYESRQAAEAGTASVPAYFRQGGARPRLSAVSELLP